MDDVFACGRQMSLDRLQNKECRNLNKKGSKKKKKKQKEKIALDVCSFARTNFLGEVGRI
jgi:hypothetical protein